MGKWGWGVWGGVGRCGGATKTPPENAIEVRESRLSHHQNQLINAKVSLIT